MLFFYQKTAYDMRNSDGSSDVYPSDLSARGQGRDGSGQHAQSRQRTRKHRPRHILPQIRSSLGVLVLQWLIWYYPCAKSGGAPLIERLRLDRVHGIVRKAEMVAHLMHQQIGRAHV